MWWSGLVTSAVQLGVAVIPIGRAGDWSAMSVASTGTMLAYTSASLPQWRKENWTGRVLDPEKTNNVALTEGNGSHYAIIVQSKGKSLDLGDLATGSPPDIWSTRLLIFTWLSFG